MAPDGKTGIVGGWNGSVFRLWDLEKHSVLTTFSGMYADPYHNLVVYSPDEAVSFCYFWPFLNIFWR